MKVVLSFLIILCFLFYGCSTSQITSEDKPNKIKLYPKEERNDIDWISRGDSLSKRIFASQWKYGGKIDRANKNVIGAGASAILGGTSAAIIGFSKGNSTIKKVGLSISILTAAVGLFEFIKGQSTKSELTDYVKDANKIIGKWEIAKINVNDNYSKQNAYFELVSDIDSLKQRYLIYTYDINLNVPLIYAKPVSVR